MQKVVLSNGLTVLFEPKPGNAVVVEVMIKVGSNHEAPSERGISHFLEHILFEGTEKRATNQEISNEIERIGGDFNAYTTNERTCYYVKVLKKHFSKAIEILADILQHSVFKEEHITKEKNIVLKEIDMVNDEPRFYQWLLLQENMFKQHPCRFPTYGDRRVIKSLNRKKVMDYFSTHYVPQNMIISIVGDVKKWKEAVENNFVMGREKMPAQRNFVEPVDHKTVVKTVKKKVANTYCVMGFKTVPRGHKDSYVFDVINGILGRGQSGKMFTEIRGKRGFAYDVGTQHVAEVSFGYFAVYASIDKKNLVLVKKLALEELQKLKRATAVDLKEAKDYIEGDYLLELEDCQKVADQFLFWEQVDEAHSMNDFLKQIQKVTQRDISRVVDEYLKYYTMIVIEGK